MLDEMQKVEGIKGIGQETPLVKSYVFDYSVGAMPGQFVNVWLPGVNERPMSVAFDDGKELTLAIAAVGSTTREMAKMKVGSKIGIRGPYGTHFTYKLRQHIAMIAGGYGVAPLYFCAFNAVREGCTVDFFLGARSKEHLLFMNRLKKLKRVKIHIATDDGSMGEKGYNTAVFKRKLKTSASFDLIMTCGPELMMKKVSDLAWSHKIPCQISLERYMKCGFGICGNCVVDDLGITTCGEGTIMDNHLARKVKEFGVYHRDAEGKKRFF